MDIFISSIRGVIRTIWRLASKKVRFLLLVLLFFSHALMYILGWIIGKVG